MAFPRTFSARFPVQKSSHTSFSCLCTPTISSTVGTTEIQELLCSCKVRCFRRWSMQVSTSHHREDGVPHADSACIVIVTSRTQLQEIRLEQCDKQLPLSNPHSQYYLIQPAEDGRAAGIAMTFGNTKTNSTTPPFPCRDVHCHLDPNMPPPPPQLNHTPQLPL